MKRAVVVMAKLPRAGRVKTRLCSQFSAETAVELYRAFLFDVLELVDRAPIELERVLACALEPGETAEDLARSGWRIVEQRGADLGERMENALLDSGAKEVMILGSDSPTLPLSRIEEAFAALSTRPARAAVLGPATDGGYYTIATRADTPELFRGIPWSTPAVMSATRERARAAGIELVELPELYDIDEPDDLGKALADARAPGSIAVRTRAAIERALTSKDPAV